MTMAPIAACLTLVAWLGTARPAAAATAVQVDLFDFRIELIDLDLHDGITPSLSFLTGGFGDSNGVFARASTQRSDAPADDEYAHAETYDLGLFDPRGVEAVTSLSSSRAQVVAPSGFGSLSLSASGVTADFSVPSGSGSASFQSGAYLSVEEFRNFRVTGNTQVVLRASWQIDAAATGTAPEAWRPDSVSAAVTLSLARSDGEGDIDPDEDRFAFTQHAAFGQPIFFSQSGSLEAVLSNTGAAATYGRWAAGATTSASTAAVLLAVDEPTTGASLGAGLLALMGWARRQSRRRH